LPSHGRRCIRSIGFDHDDDREAERADYQHDQSKRSIEEDDHDIRDRSKREFKHNIDNPTQRRDEDDLENCHGQ
jgi:hypothetical protein